MKTESQHNPSRGQKPERSQKSDQMPEANQTIESQMTRVESPLRIAKPYERPSQMSVIAQKKSWSLMERLDMERRGITIPPEVEPRVKLFDN